MPTMSCRVGAPAPRVLLRPPARSAAHGLSRPRRGRFPHAGPDHCSEPEGWLGRGPVDVPPLARLCMALTYADEAAAQVLAVGLLVEAPDTKLPIQSSWVAIMNRQTEIARKLAAELALPPTQRRSAARRRVERVTRRVGRGASLPWSKTRHGRRRRSAGPQAPSAGS